MTSKSWFESPGDRFVFLLCVAASVLIDAAFVIIWAFVQSLSALVIEHLGLTGVDEFTLLVYRWTFAIATFVPIVLYIAMDVMRIIIRIRREIQQELKRNGAKHDASRTL